VVCEVAGGAVTERERERESEREMIKWVASRKLPILIYIYIYFKNN
jgi:hypothetical protein